MSPTPFTRAIIFAGVLSAILVGCSGESPESGDSPDQTQQSSTTTIDAASVDVTQTVDEVLAANDTVHLVDDVDVSAGVDVDLSSPGKTDGVSVDGSTVTITAAGTYRLSGTLSGSLQIAAPDAHVTLILDGVTITSTSGPGIAATDVDELTVFLAEGSVNTVSDAAEYPQDIEANAALFSAGDLSITGVGTLNVQGAYEDAIASKDGLIIDSGTISVTAADDGIRGKDYVVVTSGEVSVTAGGDGLTANNDTDDTRGFVVVNGGTITVAARGDGISAETDLLVTGGQLTVESGTGSATAPTDDISTKGLKSGVMTIIAAGELTVDAQDDALHSNGAIVLTGGEILLASGDDAVHADGHLRASEGTLTITSSVEGIEGYHIALEGTTIDLVASDDGLNATGGNDMTTDGQAPPQSDDTEGVPRERPNDGTPPDGRDMPQPPNTDNAPDANNTPDADNAQQRPQGVRPQGGGMGMEAATDASLAISAGRITITAGGDGIDSNGSFTMTGGEVRVDGPTRGGNGSLDVAGEFTLTGGTLLALGTADMPVNPNNAEQAWIRVDTLGASEGDTVTVTSAQGDELLTTSVRDTSAALFWSSPLLADHSEVTVSVNGEVVGTATVSTAGTGAADG